MATVLRPAPAPLAFRPVSLPVRRPGSVGSPAPIVHPMVRMLPPSGSSSTAVPPPGEELCSSCGNAFMPDAIFCRYCGQKREQVDTQSVQSINYNSLFSGPVSPEAGSADTEGVAAPLYTVGYSGAGASATKVYTTVAAPSPLYNGGVSGTATPTGPAQGPPVYHVDPALYGGLSGTVTPTHGGARVYHVEPPLCGGLSGTVTPTSGGAMVYPMDPLCGGSAQAATSLRGPMSGTVTPTAPVISCASQPGARAAPPAMMMEPSTLAALAYSAQSLPKGPSSEVPATPVTTATSAPRHSRFTSYTPAPIQVSAPPAVPLNNSACSAVAGPPPGWSVVKPCPGAPRLSVSIPSVPSGWTTPPLVEKQVPEPQVPPSLTAGLPDPTSIERQKTAYSRGLEEQLRHGTDVLAQQLKQQSDYLFAMGDQRKRQFALQVDQEIKQREMELAQQHNEQLLLLQQAAQQQKSALEHQANALLLEYNQKKAQEDLSYQQYQFQKKQYETQLQYNEEMKELQDQQSAAQQQVAHQRQCIAQQAAEAARTAEAARQARASAHPGATQLEVVGTPAAATYPVVPQQTFAALP